jgi:hypothetical protein
LPRRFEDYRSFVNDLVRIGPLMPPGAPGAPGDGAAARRSTAIAGAPYTGAAGTGADTAAAGTSGAPTES